MTTICQDVPTLTTTILQTTTSLSEITTSFTTTLPDTTTTITTTSCTLTVGGLCAATETLTTTSTISGATQTLPTTTTVPVTLTTTSTSTGFSKSCTTSTTTTSQTTQVITTPTTSTNPNGQVSTFMATVTVTTTPTDTGAPPPSQSDNGSNNGGNGGGGGGSPSNLGAIIGGTVGGIVGLAAIVLVIWFIIKRRKRWDDIFDHDEALGDPHHPDRRFSLSADLDGGEPKPYQYGLVGVPGSSPQPSSPPMGSMTLSDTTASHYPPSQAYSDPYYGQQQGYNPARNVSPLNLPVAGIATAVAGMQGQNQLHTPSSMSTSRPSTAGSTQPLSGPAQTTYPPGIQSYYNQPQQQPQQHQRGQSNVTSHSTTPSLNGPPVQPLNGWMMNTGVPALPNQNQNTQQQQWNPGHQPQQLSDDFRAGSPISYQEPRRLQVANHRDSIGTPIDEDGPVGFGPTTGAGVAGMGAFGLGSRTSASASSVSPTEASQQPQRDGKGRIVSPGNVVVHTDGGRVGGSSSTPAPGGTSAGAPPAYAE